MIHTSIAVMCILSAVQPKEDLPRIWVQLTVPYNMDSTVFIAEFSSPLDAKLRQAKIGQVTDPYGDCVNEKMEFVYTQITVKLSNLNQDIAFLLSALKDLHVPKHSKVAYIYNKKLTTIPVYAP